MDTITAGPVEAEAPRKSFPERLLGVFISPAETFADVARKPDFIAPLVLLILLSVVATEVFLHKIGMEPVIRWALENGKQTSQMKPDEIQGLLQKVVPLYTVFLRVLEFIWVPLVALVAAVVGLIAAKSMAGGKITFKTAFSISIYAYLVNIIYLLMMPIMAIFGDPEHYISNAQNPTPTSVGFFLDPLAHSKPVLAMAGSLEIFTLWNLVLLAVGFSEATGRKTKVTPFFLIFFGLWLLMVLIKAGLASLGG